MLIRATLYLVTCCLAIAQPLDTTSNKNTSGAITPPAEIIETLHTALEVRRVFATQTKLTKPAKLQGVVTFVHAERRIAFISDSTGGVAVWLSNERASLPAVEDFVSVTGTTTPNALIPTIHSEEITVEQKGKLPPPRETTSEEALAGIGDAQWVEMHGQLRLVEVVDGWLRLTLNTPSGEFTVSIPSTERPQAALGSLLRVRGVCFTWLINNTSRIGGYYLFSPSLAQVDVLNQTSTDTPTLTQINQIQRLRAEESKIGRPVQLRGVVTFAHPDQRIFYLNDTTGGILVWIDDNSVASPTTKGAAKSVSLPATGAFVTVRGRTSAGVLTASVYGAEIESQGTKPLPAPRIISLEQAMTGEEDGQWVEMRGHLRQIDVFGNWLRLTLTATVGDFLVSIPRAAATDIKIGSFLHVRGVCQPWLNEKFRIGGIFLYTPSLNNVMVAEAALANPFAAPEEAIKNLQQYRMQTLQQVLIRGVVIHQIPGRYAIVENATGVVQALSRSDIILKPGDRVDVVGYPGRRGNRSVLRDAIFRLTGTEPAPTPLSPRDGLKIDPTIEGRLVTVTGLLVSSSSRAEDTRVMIQVNNSVIETIYQGQLPSEITARWETGSEISATGLYWIEYDDDDHPAKFSLQLRSPEDIIIRKKPSWWTATRALTGLGLIGGCFVFGLVWVAVLRRQVRQQTDTIRTQWEKEANLQVRHGEIIQNASDFIFTTDLTGRFTSFNPAGERITGYSHVEALQFGIRDLIAPEDAATGTALLSLALVPEQAHTPAARFETRFQTRDGRQVWMEISARLTQEAGRPSGLLGIARDITERKQLEDELRRARTAAEATTQAKSTFLANMSHEIRTPLAGVIGMSNLLLDTTLLTEQREFAETIQSSAQALLTILNDILDFSKIEAGKLQFEHTPFDLNSPVEESLGLLAARALAKEIHLASDIPPDLPRKLQGDPGRLRQVLMNLLGNAVKFTEKGEVIIAVSREEETPTHIQLLFEVSDTGVGMSEETQQQLFKPFSQADASTTRRFGGTGLGLAISKQLVELMGGTIGVRSQPGHGSTFWFMVSLEKKAEANANSDPTTIDSIAGARLLTIVDQATNLKIISQYLEAWNIRSDSAKSIDEALRLARIATQSNDPYRLIILDNDTAEGDGITLAKTIRHDTALGNVPLILLNPLDGRLPRQELSALGIRRVLKKPIRQDDLRRSLLRLLGPQSEADSVPPQTDKPAAQTEPSKASTLRVIVAEDNQVNQRIIEMQLKKLGIKADMAGSGHELLAAVDKNNYDLVLMDCQMPEMDGYEATRRLRASGKYPNLRIIAMTANAMQGDREKCLEAGMNDYLSKPIRVDDLRRAVEQPTSQ